MSPRPDTTKTPRCSQARRPMALEGERIRLENAPRPRRPRDNARAELLIHGNRGAIAKEVRHMDMPDADRAQRQSASIAMLSKTHSIIRH